MTASDFTYDIHSQDDTDAFFALMAKAGVQESRIEAMRETRKQALLAEAAALETSARNLYASLLAHSMAERAMLEDADSLRDLAESL